MMKPSVLFASSEIAPFAKTGGLADVAGSLPKELVRLGVDVRTVMPLYGSIPEKYRSRMEYKGYIYVDVSWRHQYCGIFQLEQEGVVTYFLDNEYYFKRGGLYGYDDEAERYVFFSKALLQFLPAVNFKPAIIHLNDWQTALCSLYMKTLFLQNDFYKGIKTIYTIHNLKYQGVFPKECLKELAGLGWEHFTVNGIEFYDQINCMKCGIIYSDLLTTVSKTYADEIKTSDFGENLHFELQKRSDNLIGIINGIDYEINNPSTDKKIKVNYSSNDLTGKLVNKSELQRISGLPENPGTPVIGVISRLTDQKGFDLIETVLQDLLQDDIQLIVLGTGEYKYEELFRKTALQNPAKISASLKFDATLAQMIYAGSDMFLMPSLFEPCGLSQMISLRYGTIPIVRETGGLKDTIIPYNEFTGEGNGFSFTNYNAHDMLHTIRRALYFYRQPDVWNMLMRKGMEQDFSWSASAARYVELYANTQ